MVKNHPPRISSLGTGVGKGFRNPTQYYEPIIRGADLSSTGAELFPAFEIIGPATAFGAERHAGLYGRSMFGA